MPRRPRLANRVFKGARDGEAGTLRRTLGWGGGVLVFVLSLFGLCSPTSLFKFLNIFLIRWLFLFSGRGLKNEGSLVKVQRKLGQVLKVSESDDQGKEGNIFENQKRN